MFHGAELGQALTKDEYAHEEEALRTQLLEAQRAVRQSRASIAVVVSGVEGAGKSEVVNLLHSWLDPRAVQCHAFWDETDETRRRPPYWRFWRALPPRGHIALMFGSWYTRPIVARALGEIGKAEFERELARIVEFEAMLAQDDVTFVKCWYHLSRGLQKKRLAAKSRPEALKFMRRFGRRYDDFLRVSERALRVTDTGVAPWHVIEAGCTRWRDVATGKALLAAANGKLAELAGRSGGAAKKKAPAATKLRALPKSAATVLDRVKQTPAPEGKALKKHQDRLGKLAWEARRRGRSTVIAFEGWDAAGKGGAIRRVTTALDTRLFQVISIAAPTDEERAHHYLWRFWRHVPLDGNVTIYDRTWYGRVLVERVEGFAKEPEWRRAYQEINDFEEQLCEHGAIVVKFWLHITPEEQLRRFQERQATPWKQHKITDEDWRNREKWSAYAAAVSEMVARTSTAAAPWTIVGADDKRAARLQVVQTVADRLEAAL